MSNEYYPLAIGHLLTYLVSGLARFKMVSKITKQSFIYLVRKEGDKYFVNMYDIIADKPKFHYAAFFTEDRWKLVFTSKSNFTPDHPGMLSFSWLLRCLRTGQNINHVVSITYNGRCGCCLKPLRVPKSKTRGVGLHCLKKKRAA